MIEPLVLVLLGFSLFSFGLLLGGLLGVSKVEAISEQTRPRRRKETTT